MLKNNKYRNIVIILLSVFSFILIKKIFFTNSVDIYDKNQQTKSKENFLVNSISKIEYKEGFKYNSNKSTLFFSDAKGNKIFVISLNGKISYKIGSGKKGYKDGNFIEAEFCSPNGIALKDNILYVADSCNNAIRKINFKNKTVSTLIKDSEEINNPIDIEFFPNKKSLAVSLSSNLGLKFYNIKKDKIVNIINNGNIEKIFKYNDKLYFLNTAKNSIGYINKDKEKFDFYEVDINSIKINSFYIDDTGLYLLDKNSNKIFKSNSEYKNFKLYSGNGFSGNDLGEILNIKYNSPNDIIAIKDRIYISDSGNYRIVEIDKNNNSSLGINIYPDIYTDGLNVMHDYLNSSIFKDKDRVSYGTIGNIYLNLNSSFKFTENAPSSLYIFEQNNDKAVLIKSYSSREILSKNLVIPKLKKNKSYYIQGTFYYCKKEKISPCLVKNFNKKIIASENKNNNQLNIEF
jgi:hypothetical protein